jgi:Cu(I)/Ag(I) efflux system membrane fusion protein
MKNKILLLTLLLVLAALFAGCQQTPPASSVATGQKWSCTMHPSIVQDKPGKCPICGMNLVPIKPAVETIQGRAAVELNEQQEKLIGLRVEPARKLVVTKTVRAPGRVQYVEGNYAHLSFRAKGFVEKLYVNATGQAVKAGDPLLDIYSPDLLVAQREFLFALQLAEKPETKADENSAFMAQTLLGAATKKLELLGLTAEQIVALEKSREVKTNVTIYSPLSGVVDHKGVALKQMITDAEHIDIVDLSTV